MVALFVCLNLSQFGEISAIVGVRTNNQHMSNKRVGYRVTFVYYLIKHQFGEICNLVMCAGHLPMAIPLQQRQKDFARPRKWIANDQDSDYDKDIILFMA
jgi:hypothetical protein